MKTKLFLALLIISSFVLAQNDIISEITQVTFKVGQYKGNIDNSPITMLLTFFPDSSITGYYYYDKVGRLFTIHKLPENPGIKLQAEQIESFTMNNESRETEIFEFPKSMYETINEISGKWIYKGKEHTVNLTRENLKFDWRLFRYKSIGYYSDSPFREQTKNYSIIYPSISTSPKLNAHFLSENNSLDKNTIDFINSTQSKYLFIEQNFGNSISEEDDCCWSVDAGNFLVYISDSILTYSKYQITYGYRLFDNFNRVSINLSDGFVYTIENIFNKEHIDEVLTLLRNKYKTVLRQEGSNTDVNKDAPLASSYTEESYIYISKGGIYFREYSFGINDYYDLFLSFDEVRGFLNDSFKTTMGLK